MGAAGASGSTTAASWLVVTKGGGLARQVVVVRRAGKRQGRSGVVAGDRAARAGLRRPPAANAGMRHARALLLAMMSLWRRDLQSGGSALSWRGLAERQGGADRRQAVWERNAARKGSIAVVRTRPRHVISRGPRSDSLGLLPANRCWNAFMKLVRPSREARGQAAERWPPASRRRSPGRDRRSTASRRA